MINSPFDRLSVLGRSGPNGAPSNLTVVIYSDTQANATLTMNATNADGVSWEYCTDAVNYSVHGTSVLGAYSYTGLTAATKYYFRARNYKGGQFSAYTYGEFAVTEALAIRDGNTDMWLDSTDLANITRDANNLVALWKDKLGSGNDPAQATDGLKPKYSNRNGIYSMVDGTYLKDAWTLAQPIFIYLVVERFVWIANKSWIGGVDSTHRMDLSDKTSSPNLWQYAGTTQSGLVSMPDSVTAIIRVLYNGASSKILINEGAADTASNGTQGGNGIVLFNYYAFGAVTVLGSIKEVILRKTADDAPTEAAIYSYLSQKWILPTLTEKFDGVFANSVIYADLTTWKERNPRSNYSFYYDGNRIRIKVKPQNYIANPTSSYYIHSIAIFVNDVYYDSIHFTHNYYMTAYLPEGSHKKITLIEGATGISAGPIAYYGTWITSILGDASYAKIDETVDAERLVFVGDSIMSSGGYGVINAQTQLMGSLFKIENNKDVGIHGWSAGTLKFMAETGGLVVQTVTWIGELFSTATDKKLIIAIGTNDHGLDGTAAATFQGYYEALLDAIHTADEDIQIWCISPLLRDDANENATLDDYRIRIGTVCAARSTYCTHIAGKPILAHPADFYDYLHPSIAGHKKYKDAVYSVIYP